MNLLKLRANYTISAPKHTDLLGVGVVGQSRQDPSCRGFPRQDRRYLEGRGITVREVIEGGKKGVILTGITLPEGKYQVAQVDILILLPPSSVLFRAPLASPVPPLQPCTAYRASGHPGGGHGRMWQNGTERGNPATPFPMPAPQPLAFPLAASRGHG